MKLRKISVLALAVLFAATPLFAATYNVDLDHTTVSFKIKHLLSNVRGQFDKFEGTIEYEPGKPETWAASGSIDVDSIDTNVPERDKHLKSPDFFDLEKYPKITFKTTGVREATETSAKLDGTLTMHGVEKPITLDLTINGVAKDPWGNTRASFSAVTSIDRKDFGIVYNSTLETGGLLLGEIIDVELEVEALLKK